MLRESVDRLEALCKELLMQNQRLHEDNVRLKLTNDVLLSEPRIERVPVPFPVPIAISAVRIQTITPNGRYVPIARAARELGLTLDQARARFDRGDLPGVMTPGGHRRVLLEALPI